MTTIAVRLTVAIVRAWVGAYTCGLPAAEGLRRRIEIESDIWNLRHDPDHHGGLAVALQILVRLIAGMPDDVGWRWDRAVEDGTLTHGSVVWCGRLAGALCFLGALWFFGIEADRARTRVRGLAAAPPSIADQEAPRTPDAGRGHGSVLSTIAERTIALVSSWIGPPVSAQSPSVGDAEAFFEVASIRRNPTGAGGPSSTRIDPGGRYNTTNIPIRLLIGQAYRVRHRELVGGPDWISNEHFDITAKANRDLVSRDGRRLLEEALRRLLTDRFKLVVHNEMREVPIYALVLARPDGRLGPGLTRSTRTDCDALLSAAAQAPGLPPPPPAQGEAPPCGARTLPAQWAADGLPLSYLAGLIEGELDRPVVDRTGLIGRYNFHLTWTPERPLPEAVAAEFPPVDPAGPSFVTAVREQLGLRLEPTTGPVEVLVIDSIERPQSN